MTNNTDKDIKIDMNVNKKYTIAKHIKTTINPAKNMTTFTPSSVRTTVPPRL